MESIPPKIKQIRPDKRATGQKHRGKKAGSIAALYYGFDAIPKSWTFDIKKYMTIMKLCETADQLRL